jgi:endo-1,4-beta-xylanase
VILQGQYSVGTDNTGLLLYVESSDPTSQYYVDDFSITLLAPPPGGPQDNSGLRTNWESGTVEGWQPRIGRETLTATTADKHSGNYSLLTTGRQREFDGPKVNVAGKMYNGSRYRVSVWVKLAPGEDPISIRVSLERTLGTSTTFHTVVPNTTVTADAWVLLTTVYDYAFNHTALNLYVENAAVTPVRAPSFYIDDFDITYLPPPEIERDIPSVSGTLSSYFPIGAAIYAGDISGVHSELLKKHFNSVTAENDMKPGPLHPTEATFNFAPADALVSFAKTTCLCVVIHSYGTTRIQPGSSRIRTVMPFYRVLRVRVSCSNGSRAISAAWSRTSRTTSTRGM